MRESPTLDVTRLFLEEKACLHVHDPKALENAKKVLGNTVLYFEDMYEAMEGCDALLILPEWNYYRNLNLERAYEALQGKVILDARNVLDPAFCFPLTDIRDIGTLRRVFEANGGFYAVFHLATVAGVRYSMSTQRST